MDTPSLALSRRIAAAVAREGGRAFLAGGSVRDRLLGRPVTDADVEVFGLAPERLGGLLRRFGKVVLAGRQYPVWRVGPGPGLVDVTWGGESAAPEVLRGACARRDLTVNALLADPLTGELLDLVGGVDDLAGYRLRPVSRAFLDDPLRPLRVMRFAGTLGFTPTKEAISLCRQADVGRAAGERIWSELSRLLLEARRPSLGLAWIPRIGLGRVFPELTEMVGVPQDPRFHPEGDVWTHTLMVVDEAAKARTGDPDRDLPVMLAALLHDVAKPKTTFMGFDGRVRSPEHDTRGARMARAFLERHGRRGPLADAVEALVREHLRPAQLMAAAAVSDGAVRRLVERVDLESLIRLARADHLGRGTPEAREGRFPAGDWLAERARALGATRPLAPLVLGRDVLALGVEPGPEVGRILGAVREAQLDGRVGSREEALGLARELAGRG